MEDDWKSEVQNQLGGNLDNRWCNTWLKFSVFPAAGKVSFFKCSFEILFWTRAFKAFELPEPVRDNNASDWTKDSNFLSNSSTSCSFSSLSFAFCAWEERLRHKKIYNTHLDIENYQKLYKLNLKTEKKNLHLEKLALCNNLIHDFLLTFAFL